MPNGHLLAPEPERPENSDTETSDRRYDSAHVFLNGNVARRRVASIPFVYWDIELKCFGLATRPSGVRTWFVMFRRHRKLVRKSLGRVGVVTAGVARRLARIELARATLDGLPVVPSTEPRAAMLFRDFMPIFVADYGRHWKPSTLAGNAFCLRHFIGIFGDMELRAIRRSDVLVWRDSWITRKGSFNRSIPVLSVMMSYAEQLGFRPAGSNPCRGTPRYKMGKMERFLSAAEYRRLASALADVEQERSQAVSAIRLLLFTGARSPEIDGLRWEWVQPPRLMLPHSKTGPKIILLNAPARAVLEAIAPHDRTGPVFAGEGRGGKMPFRAARHWPSIRKLAALPDVRLRDLRHSFASIAIADGISLMQIGKLLGHALPETTARYAHLADDVVADAAQRVSGSLARCLEAGA